MKHDKPEIIAPLTGVKFFLCILVITSNMLLYRDVNPGFIYKMDWHALMPFLTITFRVDVFFMITGFLLMHLYKNHFHEGLSINKIKEFLIIRLSRIYPLYILVLILILILYELGIWQAVNIMDSNSEKRIDNYWNWIYNITLTTAWGFSDGKSAWNGPAWSISAEFFNYLMFPIYILALIRIRKISLNIAFLFLLIASYGLMQHFWIKNYMEDYGIGALARANFGLVSGAFVYKIYTYMKDTKSNLWDICFILNIIIIITMMAIEAYTATSIPEISYMGFLILMVLCLSLMQGSIHNFFAHPIIMHLGKISFAMYLLHQPVCRIMLHFFHNYYFSIPEGSKFYVIINLIIVLAIIIAVSHIAHQYIETPLRYMFRKKMGIKKAIVKI